MIDSDRLLARWRLARGLDGLRCEAVWCKALVDQAHGYCSPSCARHDSWRRPSWRTVHINAPVAAKIALAH